MYFPCRLLYTPLPSTGFDQENFHTPKQQVLHALDAMKTELEEPDLQGIRTNYRVVFNLN